jgi:hypothetical protein
MALKPVAILGIVVVALNALLSADLPPKTDGLLRFTQPNIKTGLPFRGQVRFLTMILKHLTQQQPCYDIIP